MKVENMTTERDEYFSLRDFYRFVEYKKKIIIIFMIVFGISGFIYYLTLEKYNVYVFKIDVDKIDTIHPNQIQNIKSSIPALFNKEKYTDVFAKAFIKSLESQSQNEDIKKQINQFIREIADIQDSEPILQDMVESALSQVFRNEMLNFDVSKKTIKSKKFRIYIDLDESLFWKVFVSTKSNISEKIILVSAVEGIQSAVLKINADRAEERLSESKKIYFDMKSKYQNEYEDYISARIAYEADRNKLMIDFYTLMEQLNSETGTSEKQKHIEKQQGDSFLGNDVDDLLDFRDANYFSSRIAKLFQQNKINKIQFNKFHQKLDEISKNKVIAKSKKNSAEDLYVAYKNALSHSVDRMISPSKDDDVLPSVKSQIIDFKGTAVQENVKLKSIDMISFVVIWSIVGFFVSLIGILLLMVYKPLSFQSEKGQSSNKSLLSNP